MGSVEIRPIGEAGFVVQVSREGVVIFEALFERLCSRAVYVGGDIPSAEIIDELHLAFKPLGIHAVVTDKYG